MKEESKKWIMPLFGDGAHILYVNGEYRNLEHPVGSLMHDFNCKDAKDMVNPLLAEEVRYLKETEGGRSQMSRILEEMRNEVADFIISKEKFLRWIMHCSVTEPISYT